MRVTTLIDGSIYQVLDDDEIEVCEIERITPNHDYKKVRSDEKDKEKITA